MGVPGTAKRAAAALLLAAAVLLAAAAPAPAGGLVAEIRERGVLRVGMSIFVPWAMRDREGRLIGFEIDVASKVAEDMGVRAEFVPVEWSGIIPALLAEEFDMIIGGMSITPERSRMVDFTVPYARTGKQVAASRRLADGFHEPADFNRPGVVVACRLGATPCATARELFPEAEIALHGSDAAAFTEVVEGRAHAMISSAPLPLFWAQDHPEEVFIAFGGRYLARGEQGFALRKGDAAALEYFNGWIAANTRSGWLGRRHNHWFRLRPAWRDKVAPGQ